MDTTPVIYELPADWADGARALSASSIPRLPQIKGSPLSRWLFPLLCLALLGGDGTALLAAAPQSETSEARDKEPSKETSSEKAEAKPAKPIPKEECSTTHH